MGKIVVRDPTTGMPYVVGIAGDTPTEAEQARIDSFLSSVSTPPAAPAPAPVATPEDTGGGILGFGKDIGRGFASTFANVPAGIGALGEVAFGKPVGSTDIGRSLATMSETGRQRVTGLFGEGDGDLTSNTGEALGSLIGFLVPAAGVAKGASLVGAGLKGAQIAGGLTASGMGAALGAQDQLARIEQALARGERVSDDQIRKAVLIGGGIGLTEGIPVEMILGSAVRFLGKVPKQARDEAIRTIAGRLKNAGINALAEGGQELFAGIAQDLTEKGIYNPNIEVGQSALDDLAAGGAAGGAISFLLDSMRGRQLVNMERKDRQIEEDIARRAAEADEQVQIGRAAIVDEEGNIRRAEALDRWRVQAPDAAQRAEADLQARASRDAEARKFTEQKTSETSAYAQRATQAEDAARRAELAVAAARGRTEAAVAGNEAASARRLIERDANTRVNANAMAEAARQRAERFGKEIEQEQRVTLAAKREQSRLADIEDRIRRGNLGREIDPAEVARQDALTRMRLEQAAVRNPNVILPGGKEEGIDRAAQDIAAEEVMQPAAPDAETQKPVARKTPAKPPTFEQVRQQLPLTEGGSPDVTGKLLPAIETVVGERKPWGRLTADQKRQVADRLGVKYSAATPAPSQPDISPAQAEPVAPPRSSYEQYRNAFTPEYQAKRAQAANAMRGFISKIVPSGNVDLVAERVLAPELLMAENPELVEGYESRGSDGKRVIALAMDIYDPAMSQEEYEAKLREVIGHELIHALRGLGLFTDREWQSLVRAAEETKFVTRIDGKPVQRDYTFMEREIAKQGRLGETRVQSMEALQEEAVAEMFRAHLDGRMKLKGQPAGLLRRIMNFLKGIVGANRSAGFTKADQIFQRVDAGEIGARTPTQNREGGMASSFISGTFDTDNLQFHSQLARDLWSAKQRTASPAEWKAIISKMPGIKKTEIQWSGVNEWLDQKASDGVKTISREDVGRHVMEMTPRLVEYEKKTIPFEEKQELERMNTQHFIARRDPSARTNIDPLLQYYDGVPIHETYVEEGGNNYREILIADPELTKRSLNANRAVDDFVAYGHFKESNVLVHMRINDRTDIDGNPVLFIEEVQSDLGSKLRDQKEADPRVEEYRQRLEALQAEKTNAKEQKRNAVDALMLKFEAIHGYGRSPDWSYTRYTARALDVVGVPVEDSMAWARDYIRQIEEDADGNYRPLPEIMPETGFGSNYPEAYFYKMILEDEEARKIAETAYRADEEETGIDRKIDGFFQDMPDEVYVALRNGKPALPQMPFIDNAYYELAAKRMLREAAAGNYEKLAWTPGYMQAERWGREFGQRVDRIFWLQDFDQKLVHIDVKIGDRQKRAVVLKVNKDGVVTKDTNTDIGATGKSLSELIGRDNAERIMSSDSGEMTPQDMTFGKSGFSNAYDSAIRKAVEKITKPFSVVPELDREIVGQRDLNQEALDHIARRFKEKTIIDFAIDAKILPAEEVQEIINIQEDRAREEIEDAERRLARYEEIIEKHGYAALLARDRISYNDTKEFKKRFDLNSLASRFANAEIYRVIRDDPLLLRKVVKAINGGNVPAGKPVWSVRITPDLRRKLKEDTLPLYSAQPTGRNINDVMDRTDRRLNYSIAYDKLSKALKLMPMVDADNAERASQWFVTQFQDRMVPIGKIIDRLRAQGLKVSDVMDTYRKEQLYHGHLGAETRRADRGLYNPLISSVKAVKVHMNNWRQLEQVSGFAKAAAETYNSHSLAAAEAYLYARHAQERNAYINSINPQDAVGSGMTKDEADAIMRWFMVQDEVLKRDIKRVADRVDAIIRDTNRRRREAGLIGEFDDPFTSYVPLRGKLDPSSDEDIPESAGMARARPLFGATGREDPRMLGRDGVYAADIIANVMAQNTQTIQRAERNKVGRSLVELLRAHGGVIPEMRIVAYDNGQPRTPVTRGIGSSGMVQIVPEDYRARRDKYLVVKEDGRPVVVEFSDPRIAQAMNGSITPASQNSLIRGMSYVNRLLANLNTSWNPEFMFSNFPRDVATALYNIGQYEMDGIRTEVAKNVFPALMGIRDALRKDGKSEWAQVFEEFIDAGGQNSLNTMDNLASHIGNLEAQLKEVSDESAKGNAVAVKNFLIGKGRSLLTLLEDYNTVVENGMRLALFKALRDRGVSLDRAAQAARDVTTNFAKGGELKVPLNAAYLFFNASLQGSMAIFNATIRNPKKMAPTLAKIVAFGALMDMLNAALSDEDDDGRLVYDKLSNYTLEHNLIIPIRGFSDRSYLRIPLPYGLNMFFNWGRALSRMSRGTYDSEGLVNTLYGSVLETVNPFGDNYNPFTGEGSLETMIAPTIADPFFQIANNEDFADRPIYKETGQFGISAPQSHQFWASTNPNIVATTQWLNSVTGGTNVVSGAIDMNPDKVEFWLDYVTGATGQFFLRTASLPFLSYQALTDGIADDMINGIPFGRKLMISVTEREDVGAYAEKRDRVLTAQKELKEAMASRDQERVRYARERYALELRIAPAINKLNAMRNKLRQQRAIVEKDTRLTDAQKKRRIDDIDIRLNEIVARANKLMKDV